MVDTLKSKKRILSIFIGVFVLVTALVFAGITLYANTYALPNPKLTSVSNAANGVTVSWEKVDGAEKYRLFYRAEGDSVWHKAGNTASTSYTWTKAESGINYSFTVRCITEDGEAYTSSYDSTGKSIVFIAAPKITSVSNAATGAKISWGKVAGAKNYRVFYKNSAGKWVGIANTASTSYTWTGAKSGTKYTFTVRCIDAEGKNYTGGYDSTGRTLNYIAAPKLSSVANAVNGVTVKWSKVNGAANYRVFYKANGESTWHKAGNTTSASYTWTGAKSGTNYAFTVRCTTADGKTYTSGYDNTGKSLTYLAAPKISSVTTAASGIKITWGKVTGAVNYKVFYKNSAGKWVGIGYTTSTSYNWTGAKGNTNYTFTVRCVNKDGSKYTSAYDNVGVNSSYIATPKILAAINVATGTLISWDKVKGAEKYRVFYKANGESTWHKAGDTTGTDFTWTKAKSGTKYTFTVRCVDKNGKNYTSSYDKAGKAVSSTFVTSKGYKGEVKNGVVYIDGYLIANKTYPLPKSYGDGITKTAQSAFNKMKDGAKKDGISLWIQSGYRSYSYQNTIYNNYCKRDGQKEADTYSARPGHSEHQSGLAMDLNVVGNSFTGSKEAKWLEKNCYKYGFILRYPKGKTNETGYVYESWHFRYVGEDLAKKLYNGGDWITMEDYFGFTSVYC